MEFFEELARINLRQEQMTCYLKVSEFDQEIPQSHTADQPMAL